MKTFRTAAFALCIASMAVSCTQQEEILNVQEGEYKLVFDAALNDVKSRAAAEDGVKFNIAEGSEKDFSLTLGEKTLGMKLGVNGEIKYANSDEYFSVEIIPYSVSVGGEALKSIPLALTRTINDQALTYNIDAPIALTATQLTPEKPQGASQATLKLPFEVATGGLRIDFVLYNITPAKVKFVSGISGLNECEIALSTDGTPTLFKSAGTSEEGLKNHYTLIVPFTAQEGSIAGGTKIAELHDVNGGVFDITTPSAAIDLSQKQLNRFTVSESLVAGLTTVSAGVENWGEADVNTSVAGLDYDVQSDGTYHIYTGEGLKAWRSAANSANSVSARLMNDIVMPSGWSALNVFTGTFDGNGKTISGVSVNYGTDGNPAGGIINKVTGGTVKNLNVIVNKITSKGSHTGGIVGRLETSATMENCSVKAEGDYSADYIISGNNSVGALVGISVDSKIQNCHASNISVTTTAAQGDVSALLGEADGTTAITACSSSNYKINATNRAGGIVARMKVATVSVTASYSSTGEIISTQKAGGVIGEANASGTLTACYSHNITLTGTSNNGGLAGKGTVTNASSYTDVDASSLTGANNTGYVSDLAAQIDNMNSALSDWMYIASEGVFPFVITKQ